MRIAVLGAGWAGLAAAVRATEAGHAVTLYETAPLAGGRARSDDDGEHARDNGQHILLGGYARTLALMHTVGADPGASLLRHPLAVRSADGAGLMLRGVRPASLDMAWALLAAPGLSWHDKLALVRMASAWRRARFRCAETLTVSELLDAGATPRLREALLDPLCVAAMNTPVAEASAQVFLHVLRDSLFGPSGTSDLLIPQVPLGRLLPQPALAWLRQRGALVLMGTRAQALRADAAGWWVAGRANRDDTQSHPDAGAAPFEAIVLATSAPEAARLAAPFNAAWAERAGALAHEPIATLWLRAPPRRWTVPMLALPSDARHRPAQFAFPTPDPGSGGKRASGVTLVVSAAGAWAERGRQALAEAGIEQWRSAARVPRECAVECVDVRIERRATFRCTPGLARPGSHIAPGLAAAGDYVDGPYPATLEAAVRSGEAALGSEGLGLS